MSTKHGMRHTPEYKAWCSMKGRCYNQNDKKYYRYGERGIKVCDKWLNSFVDFYNDVGPRPSNQHSLHRINNDGNYEPGNVKWADKTEQANERSIAVKVTLDGKTQNLKDWCRSFNLNYHTILFRIHEMNMTPEEALITPLKKNFRNYHTIDGVTKCVKDWAKEYNIAYQTVLNRLRKGADIIEALTKPINEVMSKASYEGKRNKR